MRPRLPTSTPALLPGFTPVIRSPGSLALATPHRAGCPQEAGALRVTGASGAGRGPGPGHCEVHERQLVAKFHTSRFCECASPGRPCNACVGCDVLRADSGGPSLSVRPLQRPRPWCPCSPRPRPGKTQSSQPRGSRAGPSRPRKSDSETKGELVQLPEEPSPPPFEAVVM